MSVSESLPFSERCYREATRDAIFLFQRRRLNVLGEPPGWTYEDGTFFADDGELDEDGYRKQMSPLEMYKSNAIFGDHDTPCVYGEWITECVYLTREEGEAYGKRRAYNYEDGWRVYCVCANGNLAEVIKET